ncbi:bleomycin resistance protein [Cryptosporangium sp. NPDC051539]|uniref:bleomycin resistance protein n=1 Tax=Cryptosporangium sp. NPDC051539 TaxID=3363962 RepID=UPI0037A7AACC
MDVGALASLLEEAEQHHGAYEAVAPPHHWWDWYAAYVVSRADGNASGRAVADAGKHTEAVLDD